MANTNDLMFSKLKTRFPTEGAHIGDLLSRYDNGETFLDLPLFGTNDYVQVPSIAVPATSGRIFIAADVSMPDWTPSGIRTLISRWEPLFNFKSWLLQINTTGNVVATYSPDGSTDRAFASSVATGVADGTRKAIGADIEPTNGANRQVTFYTATSIEQGDWAQLGTVQTVAGAESIQTANLTIVAIGAHGFLGHTAQFQGKVYAAQVRNGGIAGTIVANPRFDRPSEAGFPRVEDEGRLWVPPAVAGSSLRTSVAYVPDDPDFAVVDLDVRAKVTMNDWTPSSTHWIINQGSHTNPVPDLQWTFSLHPNGALRTFVSTDGTLTGAGPESTPTGFADGSTHFLRCTVDTNNGANSVFTYYESFDEGQTWVVIGSPINDVIVNPVFQTTRPITTALLNPGGQTLHKAQLRSSIDGPIVLDAEVPAMALTYVDKAGKTWNLVNAVGAQIKQAAIAASPLLPKHEDMVAHVAAASASLVYGDDANAFWDAFTP